MSENQPTVTESDVLNFLQQNPEFFTQNKDALRNIEIPQESGDAISLASYQLKDLREHVAKLEGQLEQIHTVASENDTLLRWYLELTLEFLNYQQLDALVEYCAVQSIDELKLDAANFVLFDEVCKPGKHITISTMEEAQQNIEPKLFVNKPFCGVFREDTLNFVFGDQADGIKSAAILPLGNESAIGLFAVGSKDPLRFDSTMDTLFINYLSSLLSHFLARLK
jgi:uncharacterized protein YigA (DUF484 family)